LTSSKVFLECECIRTIAIAVAVKIAVAGISSGTGSQQRASSEIPLEGKGISSILIPIPIEVSLTFAGIPATVALGRKCIFLNRTAISALPARAIAHAWFSNGAGSTGACLWAIGDARTVIITSYDLSRTTRMVASIVRNPITITIEEHACSC